MEENNDIEKNDTLHNNDENNEIPKALQNKEINDDTKNKANERATTKEAKKDITKDNEKNNNKKFKKFYIIFILVLLVITTSTTYITIKYIDKSSNQNNENKEEKTEIPTEETKEIVKKKAEDEKYALRKYSETYNENDLLINEYIDRDGDLKLRSDIDDALIKGNYISFIQIDGLKDKQVQNNVNSKLKEKAYSFGNNKDVRTNLTANFSNVLAVSIYCNDSNLEYNENKECLNIDLSTGNEIPFEEIFVSSAPINSILSEGLYKLLAWRIKYQNSNEDNWEDDFDFSKYDSSDFEDKSMILSRNYQKEKGKIKYSLYYDKVIVYGLLNGLVDKDSESYINISFVKHLEDIAIFKRFLTKDSLYENSDIGLKNIIVCQYPIAPEGKAIEGDRALNLGFISENVYMEDFMEGYVKNANESIIKKINDYLQNFSNETKNNLMKYSNNGLIFQRTMQLIQDRDKPYYNVYIHEAKAMCDIDYFKNLAFEDYINLKTRPRADAGTFIFSDDEYEQKQHPNLKITNTKEKLILYFSLDGEYIGNNEEEAIRKTQSKDENNETTVQNIIPNTNENNNTRETNTNNSTTVNTNNINNSNTSSNITNNTNNSSNTTNNIENTNSISNNTTINNEISNTNNN